MALRPLTRGPFPFPIANGDLASIANIAADQRFNTGFSLASLCKLFWCVNSVDWDIDLSYSYGATSDDPDEYAQLTAGHISGNGTSPLRWYNGETYTTVPWAPARRVVLNSESGFYFSASDSDLLLDVGTITQSGGGRPNTVYPYTNHINPPQIETFLAPYLFLPSFQTFPVYRTSAGAYYFSTQLFGSFGPFSGNTGEIEYSMLGQAAGAPPATPSWTVDVTIDGVTCTFPLYSTGGLVSASGSASVNFNSFLAP